MTPAVVNAEPVLEGNLEPLCSELRYAGHTLQQVFREKSIAIYARALPDREPHEFELVAIQRRPESTTPSGTQVPEREGYPSNSEWGKCAWSFPIRERDFVFGLATRMAAMDGPYGAWARNQVSIHLATEATKARARREENKERLARVRTSSPKRSDPFLAASGG
jgi:hypothetical protein